MRTPPPFRLQCGLRVFNFTDRVFSAWRHNEAGRCGCGCCSSPFISVVSVVSVVYVIQALGSVAAPRGSTDIGECFRSIRSIFSTKIITRENRAPIFTGAKKLQPKKIQYHFPAAKKSAAKSTTLKF